MARKPEIGGLTGRDIRFPFIDVGMTIERDPAIRPVTFPVVVESFREALYTFWIKLP